MLLPECQNARRCYHFTLSHWKSAMTLATASCPRWPWDQAASFKDSDQFGLKSRFGDQRQMRLRIGWMTRCLDESAVTCGSEFGGCDDKLLPLISPSEEKHIPVIHFTGQYRLRSDWLVNWADNDIVMLITPTQLPKVVRKNYTVYSSYAEVPKDRPRGIISLSALISSS